MKKVLGLLLMFLLASFSVYSQTNCITPTTTIVWSGQAFAVQTGQFEVTFDVTPTTSNSDILVNLSVALPKTYADDAITILFNTVSRIQARNGSTYGASATVTYAGGKTYHFRVDPNVVTHTYSAFVTPPGGAEVQFVNGFGFRTEQNKVANLGFFSVEADILGGSVCNFTVAGQPPPPPPALQITTTGLPPGQVGVSYSASLVATGGKPPYAWSVSNGTLPAALTLSIGGTISGFPITAGTFPFTAQVTDAQLPAAVATFGTSIVIAPAPPPTDNPTCASATVNITGTNFTSSTTVTLGTLQLMPSTVSPTQIIAALPCSALTLTNPVPPPVVSIVIAPTTATVQTGQTAQFTGTVKGSTDTAVNWTAAGAVSVSTTGLATAGATAGAGTVTATAHADTTKSATAAVTVTIPPPPPVHSATLTWTASTTTTVVGYNVYKSANTGGPYGKLTSAPVAVLTFADVNVTAGQVLFYVVTAVDANNVESVNSAEVTGTIPTP